MILSAALLVLAGMAPATRHYPVPSFERLRIEAPIAVELNIGGGSRAAVRGPRDLVERLVVRSEGRTLVVQLPARSGGGGAGRDGDGEEVVLSLATSELKQAVLTGDGSLGIDRVRGIDFTAILTGAGAIRVDRVETDRLTVSISGPGAVRLAGRTGIAALTVAGPAAVQAEGLVAADARIDVAGAATLRLGARRAEVRARGGASIILDGAPACRLTLSGAARVRGCDQTRSSAASRP